MTIFKEYVVTDVYYNHDFNKHEVLAIVCPIENESTHPLAQAITDYSVEQLRNIPKIDIVDMENISGNGVFAYVDGHN
ncbi:cation transport ATPase [Virgibacillus natechei]|uniref:Cation transport ATPase n=1 Tax=Virgibacillus natechei TaxID=1216297 RepID=A0ABS4II37_9BACI|nr:hypothetical protein [Virgibacillus natechei]MBP1970618.1 cation transport ATPase [Virgibacillus natechei]UZD13991.1 hypothetical protein OLD84_05505 [Virgibacillus natechei]